MKNNNPLISIIIPVYNVEKYLDRCIESIVNQTYKNLEIILIDDGSTDNSPQICDKWGEKDNRIKVIHKENEGVSSARNIGLDSANGTYIGFVDSDDYIDKQMYKLLLESIHKNNSNIAICNYYISEKNQKYYGVIKQPNDILERELLEENGIKGFNWNKLYSVDLLHGIRFIAEVHIWEDLLFNYQILANNQVRYSYINEPLYYYVQREKSLLHGGSHMSCYTELKAIEFIIEHLMKKDIALANRKKVEYILTVKNIEQKYAKNSLMLNKISIKEYMERVNYYLKNGLLKEKIGIKNKIKIIMAVYFPKMYIQIKKLVK